MAAPTRTGARGARRGRGRTAGSGAAPGSIPRPATLIAPPESAPHRRRRAPRGASRTLAVRSPGRRLW
eukprot:9167898-Alexandrium_andersonii.AAC.1